MTKFQLIFYTGIALLGCIGLPGCEKPYLQPREDFTLSGYVYNQQTHLPVSDAGIFVEARAQSSGMGFFSPASAEAGNTVSDQNGYYELIPNYYKFTANLTITVQLQNDVKAELRIAKEDIQVHGKDKRYHVDTLFITP